MSQPKSQPNNFHSILSKRKKKNNGALDRNTQAYNYQAQLLFKRCRTKIVCECMPSLCNPIESHTQHDSDTIFFCVFSAFQLKIDRSFKSLLDKTSEEKEGKEQR